MVTDRRAWLGAGTQDPVLMIRPAEAILFVDNMCGFVKKNEMQNI